MNIDILKASFYNGAFLKSHLMKTLNLT